MFWRCVLQGGDDVVAQFDRLGRLAGTQSGLDVTGNREVPAYLAVMRRRRYKLENSLPGFNRFKNDGVSFLF